MAFAGDGYGLPTERTRMDEADMTERLDRRGWLDDAHGKGCYALTLAVPTNLTARWMDHYDAAPPNFFDRFSEAGTCLYAGASKDVYARLCDHVNAEVRQSSVMRVCPPMDVYDVTPFAEPFTEEYGYALDLAGPDQVVWVDGTVI